MDYSYFRNFNLVPKDLKNEEIKKSINLTFSCLLKFNPQLEIETVQKEIGKQIKKIDQNLLSSDIETAKIYIYPEHTIHFSIISIIEQPLNIETNFSLAREIFEEKYKIEIKAIRRELKNIVNNRKNKNESICLKWLFTGESDKEALSAISLQAYMNETLLSLSKKIEQACQKILNSSMVPSGVRIKAYPNRCAVNLFRFINLPDEHKDEIKNIIGMINENFDKEELTPKNDLTISLVISDSYLSNAVPEIENCDLEYKK